MRELVAAGEGGLAEAAPEAQPRIRRRVRRSARVGHLARTVQQPAEVDAVERRRHEPEDGQRRVAAADVWRRLDDRAELLGAGQLGERACPDR